MARGISLHIGVNKLDKAMYPLDPPNPDYPDGWDGPLAACENDADTMCELAKSQGFETSVLKTAEATVENVSKAVRQAAKELTEGDIFFISFAGHGGQLPDFSKDERENPIPDRYDETWMLYDRQFIDDEQYALYSEFEAGVRIVVVLDSCHSGTAMRGAGDSEDPGALTLDEKKIFYGTDAPVSRSMRSGDALPMYQARKKDYRKFEADVGPVDVKADVLLISACQDEEEAADGLFNGKFTATLLDVWGDGFDGSYVEFHKKILEALQAEYDAILEARGGPSGGARGGPGSADKLKPPQNPNLLTDDVKNEDFPKQGAFKI